MKPQTKKLTPPDTERCQAEGRSFMTLGPGFVRCGKKPSVIVTERVAASDGLRGSMSLCEEHLGIFKRLNPNKKVYVRKLKT